MRLAKTYASVYKERIVYLGRRFGNSYSGCMCEAVVITDDICVKGIFSVKSGLLEHFIGRRRLGYDRLCPAYTGG